MYRMLKQNVVDIVETLGHMSTAPMLDAVLSLRCPRVFRELPRQEQRRLVANTVNRLKKREAAILEVHG